MSDGGARGEGRGARERGREGGGGGGPPARHAFQIFIN